MKYFFYIVHQIQFTDEEHALFSRRLENGYDIQTDDKYNLWLEVYHPDSQSGLYQFISYEH